MGYAVFFLRVVRTWFDVRSISLILENVLNTHIMGLWPIEQPTQALKAEMPIFLQYTGLRRGNFWDFFQKFDFWNQKMTFFKKFLKHQKMHREWMKPIFGMC